MILEKLSLYMDVCCLNRPFDDQSQDRVYLESEAILSILAICQGGRFDLVHSDIIDLELSKLANGSKQKKICALHSVATRILRAVPEIFTLSEIFQKNGIKPMDSLHLAIVEHFGIDVLLTTDDQFERMAKRLRIKSRVVNPVIWLMEVLRNEQ
ncbi:MAG: PIN domain-containing protein [Oscillospiraceae bacterium]|nr:PIN domain-containing protein [Oscillospiraceae bacterium]